MKEKVFVAAAIIAATSISAAAAHPGPKLLTTGGGERTAMTAGVSYEDIDGVHLFKGASRLAGDEATPMMGAPAKTVRVTISHRAPYRSFRSLRTQGFYSGTGPKSRRYTQGFYSGN